jgi:hypothetical protein
MYIHIETTNDDDAKGRQRTTQEDDARGRRDGGTEGRRDGRTEGRRDDGKDTRAFDIDARRARVGGVCGERAREERRRVDAAVEWSRGRRRARGRE